MLNEIAVFEHKVCKMKIKVPKDYVKVHLSDGKPVLYTVSFYPSEWEEVGVEGIAE
jgi:hypothetical protein